MFGFGKRGRMLGVARGAQPGPRVLLHVLAVGLEATEGTQGGRRLAGQGYVELVGYGETRADR